MFGFYFRFTYVCGRYSFTNFLKKLFSGIAFSFLAGLPPIFGIFTALSATFIYAFFGTSIFSFMGILLTF